MPIDGGGSPRDLVVQSWIMFSIGIVLYLIRLYARVRRVGLDWQADDYLMVIAIGWFTAFIVTNITLAEGGGGSLYRPGEFASFSPENIAARVEFSKIEFASEQCMLNVIYTLKACMLFMYYRLTSNLREQTFVKICAGYSFCGYLASQLVLFLNCRPFSGYWTLPPPQMECATYFRFLVVQAIFNISSDVVILAIIVPMLWKLNMSVRDKLPLLFIFSLGFFLIICAVVSKIFTFRDVFNKSYQFWYMREAAVGIYISNLPYVWGLLRQTLSILRATASHSGAMWDTSGYGRGTAGTNVLASNRTSTHDASVMLSNIDHKHMASSESEEDAISIPPIRGDVDLSDHEPSRGKFNHKTTEIHISLEDSV